MPHKIKIQLNHTYYKIHSIYGICISTIYGTCSIERNNAGAVSKLYCIISKITAVCATTLYTQNRTINTMSAARPKV